MNTSKSDHLFQHLAVKVPSVIAKDLICIYCDKVLINAQQAPCGCRFCKKCIEVYLEESPKFCPGNEDECKLYPLTKETNFQTDNNINRRVLRLVVSCPNEECNFEDQWKNMEDHVRLCGKETVKCPYSLLGCMADVLDRDNISNHLAADNYGHAELISTSTANIVNDVRCAARQIDEQQVEIENLKNLLNETILRQEQESKKLQKTIDDLLQISRNCSLARSRPFIWRIDNFSQKKIKAEQKIESVIQSQPFYTHNNGYKMELVACPNGSGQYIGRNLFVGFRILKGEFDNILEWPFKHEITLCIINQESRIDQAIFRFKYEDLKIFSECFQKPSTYYNMDLGEDEFISFVEMTSMPGILNNGTIFIKCSVDITN